MQYNGLEGKRMGSRGTGILSATNDLQIEMIYNFCNAVIFELGAFHRFSIAAFPGRECVYQYVNH